MPSHSVKGVFTPVVILVQESINVRSQAECLFQQRLFFSPVAVPGGIAPESLTFTPLDDMIFLKWEEPVEPNGLITQYEVGYRVTVVIQKKKKNIKK